MSRLEQRLDAMRDQWEALRIKADREMDPLALSRLAKVRDEMALLGSELGQVESLIRSALKVDYNRDPDDECGPEQQET